MQAPTHSDADLLSQLGAPRATGLKRWLRNLLVVAALVGVVVALLVLRGRSNAAAPVVYLTKPVKRGDLAATVTATGTVRGRNTVTVGAETSGRVRSVLVDFNDHVSLGQLLVEVDPALAKAGLAQARAQLAVAQAEVKSREASALEAKLNASRTSRLVSENLASVQQLEAAVAAVGRAVAAVESARAQVSVADANLQSATTALAKTQIRSPIDGVVLSRDVEEGQVLAAAMAAPLLFKITSDLREMEVTLSVDEADIGQLKVGQIASFIVDAWPSRVFAGELASIRNETATKENVVTYEAVVLVKNADLLLRPGMTATVSINTEERRDVLFAPNAALRFRPPAAKKPAGFGPPGEEVAVVSDGRPRVFVLRRGEPTTVLVEVGLSDGINSEVRGGGLAKADQVVVDAEAGPER